MEETLYTYSLLNIMTIICLERKTFIFSGVSMCQSVFDYTFLCFIEKKLPQKRLAISNDVTKIYQIIDSITIQLDTNVRLIHKIIKTPNKTFTSTSIHSIEIIIYVNVRTKAEGQKKRVFFFPFRLNYYSDSAI